METIPTMESKVLASYLPPSNLAMSSNYLKCGEVFVEETLKLTLVCALCEKKFTEMELFGAHITCVHMSSEKFELLLLQQTVKEEFTIEDDPFQDENSIYEYANASYDETSDEVDDELMRITEPIGDNSIDAVAFSWSRPSYRVKQKKYLEQGKWTEFCSKCGLKFKNNEDYEIHKKVQHSNLSNEEKAQLEEKEDSIIYVAHTCPMCYYNYKHKSGFVKHLKLKHLLDPENIKAILDEDFWGTKVLSKGESLRKGQKRSRLRTERNTEQMQTNVEKQQSEAIDPVTSGVNNESQAIKQSHENLTETTNSITKDIGIKENMQTEMDVVNENRIINTQQTSNQTALNSMPQMQSHNSKNANLWAEYCTICGVKFKYKRGYELHVQLKHSNFIAKLKDKLENNVHVPIVCSVCGLDFKNKNLFSDHLKLKHNMELRKIAALTTDRRQNSRADSNQDGNSIYESANTSCDELSDEMDNELMRIKEPDSDNRKFSHRKLQKYLEQGKWTEFCSKCGLKFKNTEDYELHKKVKHSTLSNEEKAQLEEEEASIIYVAHTCPICYCNHKHRNGFAKHFELKHHLGRENIKAVLKKEFWSTRGCTKADQGQNRPLFRMEHNAEQVQTNVQKQQSEAIEPKIFRVDNESQSVKQSHENLIEFLTADKKMETTNSITKDIGIKENMFETEMDVVKENRIINTQQTSNQTALNSMPEMQSHGSKNSNLWVEFCSMCGVKFRYKLGYKLHVQLKHSDLPSELEDELENKYLDVLVHVPIVCSMCGLDFKYKNIFADHLKLKHNMELEKIAALTIEERQNSRADSNQMASIEKLLKPDVVNDVEAVLRQCREKAESKRKPEIVKEKSKRHFCTECNRQFQRPNAYNFHMRVKHGILTKNYTPPYKCEYCGKVFLTAGDHKNHVAVHRGEKTHKCPHCPKAFTDPANLRCHIRIHLNIKRYKCSYCDSRFVTSTGRKEHERSHTKEKRFQCEECGNLFPKAHFLRDHMFKHKNIETYKCNDCDKKFTSRRNLWAHSQKHKGGKFKCEHCERIFTSKKSRRNHMLLHSDQKNYTCNICKKAFAQYAGLYAHRKSHEMSEALENA